MSSRYRKIRGWVEVPILNVELPLALTITIMKREGSVFVIFTGFVALFNGALGTWIMCWFYLFGLIAVIAVIARLIKSSKNPKDAAALEELKQLMTKPKQVSNKSLSIRNYKQVHETWDAIPHKLPTDKEAAFARVIGAGNEETAYIVADKAAWEVERRRDTTKRFQQQHHVTQQEIMRPLQADELALFKSFRARAQSI